MNCKVELADAKRYIRRFVQLHWTDQRLAEAYAFNRDGRMRYDSCCACLMGVTLSEVLHVFGVDCDRAHYDSAQMLLGAARAENAYLELENLGASVEYQDTVERGQRRLSAILRAEMRRRDRQRAAERIIPTPADLQVLTAYLDDHAIAVEIGARNV